MSIKQITSKIKKVFEMQGRQETLLRSEVAVYKIVDPVEEFIDMHIQLDNELQVEYDQYSLKRDAHVKTENSKDIMVSLIMEAYDLTLYFIREHPVLLIDCSKEYSTICIVYGLLTSIIERSDPSALHDLEQITIMCSKAFSKISLMNNEMKREALN